MDTRMDIRSYAGDASAPPFQGVAGHTQAEMEAAYEHGVTQGATWGIVWTVLILGGGCTWLLWSAGVIR